MRAISITIVDHNWPMLDIIIDRGGRVKHLTLHNDRVDQDTPPAVVDSVKLALAEIKAEHNPRS